MAGKPIDFDSSIEYYESLQRRRTLTTEEAETLATLLRKRKRQKQGKAQRERNPEPVLRAALKYRLANPERVAAARRKSQQEYTARNKAKIRKKLWLYKANNPDVVARRTALQSARTYAIQCGNCNAQYMGTKRMHAEVSAGQVKFCSTKCRVQSTKTEISYTCEYCAKECTALWNSAGQRPVFCDPVCRQKKQNARRKLKRQKLRQELADQAHRNRDCDGPSPLATKQPRTGASYKLLSVPRPL